MNMTTWKKGNVPWNFNMGIPDSNSLISMYKSGKSTIDISKKYGVSKGTILNRLRKHKDWNNIKKPPYRTKTINKLIKSKCVLCGKTVEKPKKVKYCSEKCIKKAWQIKNPKTDAQKEIRRKNRRVKQKKKLEHELWIQKYENMLKQYHKRNISKIAKILIKKSLNAKYSMVTRSKKHGVECNIELNDIRKLILENYGKPCKYFTERIITYKDMAFDHIVPITKGGTSTPDNIQLITKFSNTVKGSLDETSLYILLTWLNSIDQELKKDISIRLANGIR